MRPGLLWLLRTSLALARDSNTQKFDASFSGVPVQLSEHACHEAISVYVSKKSRSHGFDLGPASRQWSAGYGHRSNFPTSQTNPTCLPGNAVAPRGDFFASSQSGHNALVGDGSLDASGWPIHPQELGMGIGDGDLGILDWDTCGSI